MELGISACNRGWWDSGLAWLQLALDRHDPTTDQDGSIKRELLQRLHEGKLYHDKLLDKRGPFGDDHRTNQLPFDAKLAKKKKFTKVRKGQLKLKAYDIVPLYSTNVTKAKDLKDNFYLMCREGASDWQGPTAEGARPLGLLRCGYLHRNDPFLRLAPIKAEEKSREPFIVVFHDFFSDDEMSYLKSNASSRLKRSSTGTSDTLKTSLTRTSKQTWLHDKFHNFTYTTPHGLGYDAQNPPDGIPPIPFEPWRYIMVLDPVAFRVSRRIERAAGLMLTGPFSAEAYQIANYGLGGQYASHHDSYGFYEGLVQGPEQHKHNTAVGDRFVTFMGYLGSVSAGGATVFPLVGVDAAPAKGSAVMWVNLYSDGARDRFAYHGGCPVLVGSKWITNKWVNYLDQWRRFPCGLQPRMRVDEIQRWRSEKAFY